MSYRRPHPVKDPRLAAERLLKARTALIDLVIPAGAVEGSRAVQIANAIETLEAAAENYGAVRNLGELEDPASYIPVSADELAAVNQALEERHADLEEARLGQAHCARCTQTRGSHYHREGLGVNLGSCKLCGEAFCPDFVQRP